MADPRPELVNAVIQQESGGDPNAVSPKGAVGLMQIMPAVAKDYGVDPSALKDPNVNRELGTKYLGDLLKRSGGDEETALIGYNQGPNRQGYAPGVVLYAANVMNGASAEEHYNARKQQQSDHDLGLAYIQAHPEFLKDYQKQKEAIAPSATAGMKAPKSPEEAAQQAAIVEKDPTGGATGSMSGGAIEDLTTKFVEKPVTEITGSPAAGKIANVAAQIAPILIGGGRALASDAETFGGVVPAIKALFGMGGKVGEAATGAAKAAQSTAAAAAAIKDKLPSTEQLKALANLPGASPDFQQKLGELRPAVRDPGTGRIYVGPTASKTTITINGKSEIVDIPGAGHHGDVFDSLPPEVAAKDQLDSGFVGADGEYMTRQQAHDHLIAAQVGSAPESAGAANTGLAAASASTPAAAAAPAPINLTPEMAAQTLAQKQREALIRARIGEKQAARMGMPEIAVKVSETTSVAKAQELKTADAMMGRSMQDVLSLSETDQAARTAAIQSTFASEARDMKAVSREMMRNPPPGFGDVAGPPGPDTPIPPELQSLANRYATFIAQTPQVIARPSEIARELEILGPTKPDNIIIADTARYAQQLGHGSNPWQLAQMLGEFTEDQILKTGAQMEKNVKAGGSFWGGLVEYYRANLLSNMVMTGGKNIIGNVITSIMAVPERALMARMPGSVTEIGEATNMVRGFVDGFQDTHAAAWESIQRATEGTDSLPHFVETTPKITSTGTRFENTKFGSAIDFLGSVVRIPFKGLTVADKWSQASNFSMEAHALAFSRATKEVAQAGLTGEDAAAAINRLKSQYLANMPADMFEAAKQGSAVRTFTNELSEAGKHIQAITQWPGVNLVVPWLKTPWQLETYGLDYLPGLNLVKNWKPLLGGPSRARDASMAQFTLSLALGATVFHGVGRGWFTGAGPQNKAARDRLLANHTKFNSFWLPGAATLGDLGLLAANFAAMDPAGASRANEILDDLKTRITKGDWGGGYVPNDVLGPFAVPISTLANAAELFAEAPPENIMQIPPILGLALARGVTSPSWMLGLGRVLSIAEGRNQSSFGPQAEQMIGDTARGFVPFSSAVAAVTRTMDPDMREVNGWLDSVKQGIPGQSATLSPKRDMFANVVQGRAGVVPNMIFPIDLSYKPLTDPVDKEIVRIDPAGALVEQTPHTMDGPALGLTDKIAVAMGLPDSAANDPKLGIPLSDKEWDQRRILRADSGIGLNLHDSLALLFDSPKYQLASEDEQRKQYSREVGKHFLKGDKALRLQNPNLLAKYIDLQIKRKLAGISIEPSDETVAAGSAL